MVKAQFFPIRKRVLCLSIVFGLIFILLFINFPATAQEELPLNLPPVSNPKLDEKKHNIFNQVEVLEDVYFIGSESYDPNPEDNLTYTWNFGDGESSTEESPIHAYKKIGEYVVRLTVNDTNASDTGIIKVIVISQGNNKPIAIIKSTASRDDVGNNLANTFEPIFFNATDSFDPDGFNLMYEWDFGDGNKNSGDKVIHEFSEDGTYKVTLTITDMESLESQTSIEIVVGTGEQVNGGNNEDESTNDTMSMGILITGIIAGVVILLLIFWLYLSKAKKRALKQVTISSTEITKTQRPITQPRKPPIPEFAKEKVQKRDALVREARVERLTDHQKSVKKDILRQKLASERKKIDDDMKKELEDMGIEF
jgi:hypothetical protein